jgi:cytochrome c oxidase subunit II
MKRFIRIAVSSALVIAAVAACSSANHSAMKPAGPRAAEMANLLLTFTIVTGAVYLIVVAILLVALVRRRAHANTEPDADRRSRLFVGAGLGLTVVVLVGLAISDFVVGRTLSQAPSDPLRIRITGHQYWWEIEYEDPLPANRLRTANELHIPVGQPVELVLTSRDVIHSFWVPSISGKKDLIPGRTTSEVLIADVPGIYQGQCAEFCGHQHAKMRLTVRAQDADDFSRWKTAQLASARMPSNDVERRGQEVFMSSSCLLCHSIQGTPAGATVGPDLTHVASRRTLAAGALENTSSNMASWIRNPQRIKPGNRMPAHEIAPADLAALVAYLESLT